jgi:hypothetical protein
MRRLIDQGTFAYCGLKQVCSQTFYDVLDSETARREALATVNTMGRDLF